MRLVTFRVGDAAFALPATLVREAVDIEGLKPLPLESDGEVAGLVRVRDRFVPVVDLPGSRRPSGAGTAGEPPVLLVLGQDRGRLGLRVDSLGEVVDADIGGAVTEGKGGAVLRLNGELIRFLEPAVLVGGDAAVLEDRGGRMVQNEQASELVRLVAVRLGPEDFGLDVMKVFEVVRVPEVRRVPRAPEFVEGVAEVRKTVVPVIDLRKRFGLPQAETGPDTRLVVVGLGDQRVGLVVDDVPGVLEISAESVSAPPKILHGLKARYMEGVVRDGERLVILLNVDEVLSSDERIALDRLAGLDDGGRNGSGGKGEETKGGTKRGGKRRSKKKRSSSRKRDKK